MRRPGYLANLETPKPAAEASGTVSEDQLKTADVPPIKAPPAPPAVSKVKSPSPPAPLPSSFFANLISNVFPIHGGHHHGREPVKCEPIVCPKGQKLSGRSRFSCGRCIPKTLDELVRDSCNASANRERLLMPVMPTGNTQGIKDSRKLLMSAAMRHATQQSGIQKCIESKRVALFKCIESNSSTFAGIPTEYLVGGAILAILLLRKRSI